ncbi:MAG: T9SS type A sorting domain-containing protein [Bacteroidota bacterium]|nr:T9SS type A sorting domain-containing protein [Bacteroidota bacterium]
MKISILFFLCFVGTVGKSQELFSRVYTVPEDGTGYLNVYPNWLTAVFPTDSGFYAFGYSADTTYKEIYGAAFYNFDLRGNLLDYYHIKDNDQYNYFYPEGIHTWDGITFYTGFNHNNRQESILKFNRITREQITFEIKNTLYPGGVIIENNFSADPKGYLITASKVETGIQKQWRKVQVTKVDTSGKIKWQKIIGKEPITTFNNIPYSTYVDRLGNIYVGVGYTNDFNTGWPAEYQSLLYKLDPDGNLVKIYNSKPSQGFCLIYDIAQDEKGWLYLSSNYNYSDPPHFPTANRGYGIIQVLDTALTYKFNINLDLDSLYKGISDNVSFKKIIRTNEKDGFIVGGTLPFRDTLLVFNDSLQINDTIYWYHRLLNLVRINEEKQVIWKKMYRIRKGKDSGFIYDIKSCPQGGYIIAASSFSDDAFEKYKEPYWMPWLLRVDNDGCLIPGCNLVKNKDLDLQNYNITLYPIPAQNYIVLMHTSDQKINYSIINSDGIILDEFSSNLFGEQIIIPINHFKSGSYFLRAALQNGHIASKLFVKQ